MKRNYEVASLVTVCFFLISTVMFFAMNVSHKKSKVAQKHREEQALEKANKRNYTRFDSKSEDLKFYEEIFDTEAGKEAGLIPPSKRKSSAPLPKEKKSWW